MTGTKMAMSQFSLFSAEAKAMRVGFVKGKAKEKLVIDTENI
jgi:hypothetical protein